MQLGNGPPRSSAATYSCRMRSTDRWLCQIVQTHPHLQWTTNWRPRMPALHQSGRNGRPPTIALIIIHRIVLACSESHQCQKTHLFRQPHQSVIIARLPSAAGMEVCDQPPGGVRDLVELFRHGRVLRRKGQNSTENQACLGHWQDAESRNAMASGFGSNARGTGSKCRPDLGS